MKILSLLLLLSLLLNGWFLWDRANVQEERLADNSKLNEVITSKQVEIIKADSLVKAIQDKRAATRVKDSIEIRGLKTRISVLKVKVTQTAPKLELPTTGWHIEDSLGHYWEGTNEEFNQYLLQSLLKDEVIKAQDSLISTLELTHAAEIRDFNEILALHQQKFQSQQQISEAWMEMAAEARKDAVKEKRRKNLFKITSGLLAAGIIFVSVRE